MHAVLDVVHGVRDVVGPVHDLRLETAPLCRDRRRAASSNAAASTVVVAVLRHTVAARPRVLARGIERGAGQVEPGRFAGVVDDLRLEPGEHPQGLRIALESPAGTGDGVERVLAVVAERRMADVVRETGGVDDVRIAAERGADLAADLRDLERVGQPGAREVVLARARRPVSCRRAGGTRTSAARERGRAGTHRAARDRPRRRPVSAARRPAARGRRRSTRTSKPARPPSR